MSTTIAVHVPNLRPRGELSVKVELRRLLSRRTKELDEAKQLVLSAKDWDDLRREMEADGSIVWRLIDGGSRKAIAVVGPKDWIDVVCDEEHASLAGSIGGFTTPPAESQRLAARRTRLDALFGHEDPMIEERVRAVEAEDRAQVAVQAAEHLSRENVECDVRATVERMVGAIDGLELLADEGEYEDGYDPDRLQIWSRRRNFIVNLSTASLAEKWMSDRDWCITMIRAAIRDAAIGPTHWIARPNCEICDTDFNYDIGSIVRYSGSAPLPGRYGEGLEEELNLFGKWVRISWTPEGLARALFSVILVADEAFLLHAREQHLPLEHVIDVMWNKTKPEERKKAEDWARRIFLFAEKQLTRP